MIKAKKLVAILCVVSMTVSVSFLAFKSKTAFASENIISSDSTSSNQFVKSKNFIVIDPTTGNPIGSGKISATFYCKNGQISVFNASTIRTTDIEINKWNNLTLSKAYYTSGYSNLAEVCSNLSWTCPKTGAACSGKLYLYCTPSGEVNYKIVIS
ncbi:hypothetical protein NNC19_19230 [Clostridium sp. SHJSY1]|uniref:hypothetical protein n=1 Tax=Clostridium sp. SHJSY1 TaxID=2942483 RepID=UPI002876252C|nr:hypothetical protein [Clostridium sp. SHJSY1]MDS0527829.1 hypothetical protein [Clostridium sp. SHJSY1]